MIDIDKTFKLTQGQGHRVKGQGQIKSFVKKIESSIKHKRKVQSE